MSPKGLQVETVDNSPRLHWTAAADSESVTKYRISWKNRSTGDSGNVELAPNLRVYTISALHDDGTYQLGVAAKRDSLLSATASIEWKGTPAPPAPDPVTNLAPISLSATSVGLSWNKPVENDSGITGYEVTWKAFEGIDSGSTTVGTTQATINNLLTTARYYTFTVSTMRGAKKSPGVSAQWAPADRYTEDRSGSVTLRMYEFASAHGSGLLLDYARGGPKNISTSASKNLTPGDVQLAVMIYNDSLIIGPAYGFPEFTNADSFDRNVYTPSMSFVVPSLDEWSMSKSLDVYINNIGGNLTQFVLPINVKGTMHQGFIVRTGTIGDYHYARVLLKNLGGKFIQGSPPDRYVTLEISYQNTPNVPYAKPRTSADAPIGVHAITRRTP